MKAGAGDEPASLTSAPVRSWVVVELGPEGPREFWGKRWEKKGISGQEKIELRVRSAVWHSKIMSLSCLGSFEWFQCEWYSGLSPEAESLVLFKTNEL